MLEKIEQNKERLKSLRLLSYGSFLKMKPTNTNPNPDTTTIEAKLFDMNQPQHCSQQNETTLGEESDSNMKNKLGNLFSSLLLRYHPSLANALIAGTKSIIKKDMKAIRFSLVEDFEIADTKQTR